MHSRASMCVVTRGFYFLFSLSFSLTRAHTCTGLPVPDLPKRAGSRCATSQQQNQKSADVSVLSTAHLHPATYSITNLTQTECRDATVDQEHSSNGNKVLKPSLTSTHPPHPSEIQLSRTCMMWLKGLCGQIRINIQREKN